MKIKPESEISCHITLKSVMCGLFYCSNQAEYLAEEGSCKNQENGRVVITTRVQREITVLKYHELFRVMYLKIPL